MHRSPKQLQNGKRRAPRISVPNNEPAKVEIGPQQFVVTLGKLSSTGGTIRAPKRFDPGTMADLTLKTNAGKVSAAIQFLAPLDGIPQSQAFRFVQMEVADFSRLEKALAKLRNQGYGEKQGWGFSMLLHTAQRTLAALKRDN
jgi:PilZ domain